MDILDVAVKRALERAQTLRENREHKEELEQLLAEKSEVLNRLALANAELNSGIRCIVLTGAGKGFCAGGDVKGMAATELDADDMPTLDERIHRQRLSHRNTAGFG